MVRPKRILIVEDEDGVRELAAAILEEAGYEVLTAANGDDALRLFLNVGADAVFTDIVMPGQLNGFALSQKIKEASPQLPVVCTTGYATHVESSSCCDTLIPKPYRPSQVAAVFERLLSR